MNYRHAFHAGNFADCLKHALLVWLLRALARKPAPFFVLDTHAGIGRYDLASGPAQRTGEWRTGIARLLDDPPAPLADFVALVRAAPPSPRPSPSGRGCSKLLPLPLGEGLVYPGSPALIRALLRPRDRLACCELHPADAAALREAFRGDRQVAVHQRDGYQALRGLLPPAEKRGLVLIDPPYEQEDEILHVIDGLRLAHARFPAAILAAWYPVKHRAPVRALLDGVQAAGLRDVVTAELLLRAPADPSRLNGCGLLVVAPPFRFETDIPPILEALLARLGGREAGEAASVTRVVAE